VPQTFFGSRIPRVKTTANNYGSAPALTLRTPLNGIMGYARLLQMEGGLNAAQSVRVEAMLGAGGHLLEIINCVLDLSQIEAGRLEIHAADMELRTTAAACLDLVRPLAEAKRLALRLVAAPEVPRHVIVDPTRLRQVLLNLLGNAIKFTSHGSVNLRLLTVADGTRLRLEVADTGPGIPIERREQLFQEFRRLDTEATSKVEGAGLDLALCRQLASLMGGCLGHEDNPGGGSVFVLELPLHSITSHLPAGARPSDMADVEPALEPAATLHVLVVDDALMNRDVASAFLRAAGHKVTCVEGGAEAVAAVAITNFDVVLMDVRMPEMDGLEATRRIRALEGARARVPIVALTAQAFAEQIVECRKAGMNSHLAKPFVPDTLLAVVVRAATVEWAHGEDISLDFP
jgi:CheY-like chemotaxis protein